jgi:hypothetical protein
MEAFRCQLAFWVLFFLLGATYSNGQNSFKLKGNEYDALNLQLTYSGQLTAGQWQKRFGPHFAIGGGMEFVTHPSNWILGFESHYLFGGQVKENILQNLETVDGQIIGNDLTFGNVELRKRGLYSGLTFGKLFNTHPTNKKEGLRTSVGIGYLWHKVRLQDDYQNIPQIALDYRKGYDRLTGGIGFTQFIAYQKLDKNRLFNFIAGIECMQAYTRSLRDWNFDTRLPADKNYYLDLAFGIRLTWILPFYIGMPSEDIFY